MRIQEAPWRLHPGEVKPGAGLGLGKMVAKSGLTFRGQQLAPVEKEYLQRLAEDPRFAESLDIVMQELELLFPQALADQPSDADCAGGGPAPARDAEGVEPARAPTRETVRALMESWHKDLGRLCAEVWEVERVNISAMSAKDHIVRLENEKVHAHRAYMQELSSLRDRLRLLQRKTPVSFSSSIDDIYFYEPTKYFEDSIREFVKDIVSYKVRQELSSSLDEMVGAAQAPAAQLVTTIRLREEEIAELKERIRDMEYETATWNARDPRLDLDLQLRKAEAEKKERLGALGDTAARKSRHLDGAAGGGGGLGWLCRRCGGAAEGAGETAPQAEPPDRPGSSGSPVGSQRASSRGGPGHGGSHHGGEGDEGLPMHSGRRTGSSMPPVADGQDSHSHGSKAASREASKGRSDRHGSPALPHQAQRLLAELAEARGQLRDVREALAQASPADARDLEQRARQLERRIRELQQRLQAEYGELLANFPELADCGINTVPAAPPDAPSGPPPTSSSPRPSARTPSRGGSPSHGGGGGSAHGGGAGGQSQVGRHPGSRHGGAVSAHGAPESPDAGQPHGGQRAERRLSEPRQADSAPRNQTSASPRSLAAGSDMLEAIDSAVKLAEELQQRIHLLSSLVGGDGNVQEAVAGTGESAGKLARKLEAVRQKLRACSSSPLPSSRNRRPSSPSPQRPSVTSSPVGRDSNAGGGQRYQVLMNELAELQERYSQAEFAISELQFKLKEMQQKLQDAGLGEIADSIMEAVGLREIASAAAGPRNVVCVFDRLYRDALERIQRIARPLAERRASLQARKAGRGGLLQMHGPLQSAMRQFGFRGLDAEAEEEDTDDPLDLPFVCPHCNRPVEVGPNGSVRRRPPPSGKANLRPVPLAHVAAGLPASVGDGRPQPLGAGDAGGQPLGGADAGLEAWVQGRSRPGTHSKSRCPQALLVQKDATDWMGPSCSSGALLAGPSLLMSPKLPPRGGGGGSPPPGALQTPTPSRVREALSPRPLAAPDRAGQERSSAERPSAAPRVANLGQASRSPTESSGADVYFPTSAPVMRPKRSNTGNLSTSSRARQASPRGDGTPLADRLPSRGAGGLWALPPVLDSGMTRTPVQRGASGNEVLRPVSNAEGVQSHGSLKHSASAPALVPGGNSRGLEAELLPRLERTPTAGSPLAVEPSVAVLLAKVGAPTLLPLRKLEDGQAEHDVQSRVGVDEEFVTISGSRIAGFKGSGHPKKSPLEDLSRLAAGAQPRRPSFLVGGQGFAV